MKASKLVFTVIGAAAALQAQADVLELKGGKILNGTYMGGTEGTIRFDTGGGNVQVIETSQAVALTFTGKSAPAAATVAPATPAAAPAAATPAPASAPAAAAAVIPAGTTLMVRMVDPVSSRDPEGKRFTATLETDLAINGATVAPAGTKVYGRVQSSQQARRFTGQSALDLRLTEIALGPNLVPISTSGFTETGSRSGGKTARGAAAGAAIGAIADDAGKGAAIGAAASGLKKGETLSVQPGTLLEFRLQQPVTLNAGK